MDIFTGGALMKIPKIITYGRIARLLVRRLTVTAVCFLLAGFCILGAVTASAIKQGSAENFQPTHTVIVDPGHGGFDGGAVVGQNIEKNINLPIALYLRDMLQLNGYRVLMTREADVSTESDSSATLAARKRSDLQNRLKRMKENPDAVFLSIHLNRFERSSVQGAQVFYTATVPGAQQLAQSVMQQVVLQTQPQNNRAVKPNETGTYILKNAVIPAVIVECGFMSNPTEMQNLTRAEYQRQLAFAICCGVQEYFCSTKNDVL